MRHDLNGFLWAARVFPLLGEAVGFATAPRRARAARFGLSTQAPDFRGCTAYLP